MLASSHSVSGDTLVEGHGESHVPYNAFTRGTIMTGRSLLLDVRQLYRCALHHDAEEPQQWMGSTGCFSACGSYQRSHFLGWTF